MTFTFFTFVLHRSLRKTTHCHSEVGTVNKKPHMRDHIPGRFIPVCITTHVFKTQPLNKNTGIYRDLPWHVPNFPGHNEDRLDPLATAFLKPSKGKQWRKGSYNLAWFTRLNLLFQLVVSYGELGEISLAVIEQRLNLNFPVLLKVLPKKMKIVSWLFSIILKTSFVVHLFP